LFDLSVIIPLAGVEVGFEFQAVNLKEEADHVIPFPIKYMRRRATDCINNISRTSRESQVYYERT
jgi:hypothetical protein